METLISSYKDEKRRNAFDNLHRETLDAHSRWFSSFKALKSLIFQHRMILNQKTKLENQKVIRQKCLLKDIQSKAYDSIAEEEYRVCGYKNEARQQKNVDQEFAKEKHRLLMREATREE